MLTYEAKCFSSKQGIQDFMGRMYWPFDYGVQKKRVGSMNRWTNRPMAWSHLRIVSNLGSWYTRQLFFYDKKMKFEVSKIKRCKRFSRGKREENKWRNIIVSLRTGGQGHATPIHTLPHPMLTHLHRQSQLQHQKCAFSHFPAQSSQTYGWNNRRTKPLLELRVRN